MIAMTPMQIVALYAGIGIVWLFVLAIAVVRARQKHKVLLGEGQAPGMLHAIRAHANAAENIPVVLLALLILAQLATAPLVLHLIGASLMLGRVVHGYGLLAAGDKVNPYRGVGMLLTWIALVGAAGVLLVKAFS
jgi:uncharacterized membrane protein YecN with MAPEG domain